MDPDTGRPYRDHGSYSYENLWAGNHSHVTLNIRETDYLTFGHWQAVNDAYFQLSESHRRALRNIFENLKYKDVSLFVARGHPV